MSVAPVNVWIESVTGERWSEQVRLFETIGELKKRVWKRKRIVPSRQAIVFAGRSLSDQAEMYSVGVREASTLKLVIVAKSGPLTGRERDEQLMLSDEVSDREYRQRSHRGCSAAEDTSAKESSAGETEKELDMDDEKKLTRVTAASGSCSFRHPRRNRTNSQGNAKDFLGACGECAPLLNAEESQTSGESTSFSALTVAMDKFEFQNLRLQSPIDEEILSEDPSELSSGVIICDLTNEFRRQKVRRHRHTPAPSTCRQRARSKPRVNHRERSSSDDNENSQTEPVLFALPIRRGVSARSVRTVTFRGGAVRCSVCAFRTNSAFNCRCGKILCSRHRAAQSHTCSKTRAKMQQVSD
ncbi:hypothetical protein KIN20_007255 [Parelaphostrongylus tenuis]|uniref:Ubiquitin-like domain-containing protein n=1 Tax=Parelaphostrongylus tenuis TaxID=148309 RepID=A0AAD5MPD0_PARTN|nr:hypothetical protein KIN20_007255 [Parelaphostrongylus tenuis]